MNKQKRYAGRAIRKERRELREMLAVIDKIDFDALWDGVAEAFAALGRVLAEATASIARAYAEYTDAVEREYRMTYRALTTGPTAGATS